MRERIFFFWIITKFKDFENKNEGRKTKLERLIIYLDNDKGFFFFFFFMVTILNLVFLNVECG